MRRPWSWMQNNRRQEKTKENISRRQNAQCEKTETRQKAVGTAECAHERFRQAVSWQAMCLIGTRSSDSNVLLHQHLLVASSLSNSQFAWSPWAFTSSRSRSQRGGSGKGKARQGKPKRSMIKPLNLSEDGSQQPARAAARDSRRGQRVPRRPSRRGCGGAIAARKQVAP